MPQVWTGAAIFDGRDLHRGAALVIEQGQARIEPAARHRDATVLDGGVICPGFVDLQVNGGGGVMFNDAADIATLRRIGRAHRGLGCAAILPTLITDRPDLTRAAIGAALEAVGQGVPGIAGLHLEGPHLDPARKGAHDAALIRPMQAADLDLYCDAARVLPALMITLAPEAASPAQIAALRAAGALVSLGHSNAGLDAARAAIAAGAHLATHLFNAMSQMGSREPGLVGAVLGAADVTAGIIADSIHVHPQSLAIAAKLKPDRLFLVSDAMAVAGSDITRFTLNGREITREAGRLSLADGTLAGADLTLARAVQVMVEDVGLPLERALAMATSIPAAIIGQAARLGRIGPGAGADILHLDAAYRARWLHAAGG